ncbi:MAG TPA: ABC transporter permease [Candidatus Limnocylindrales bacterium]|nr:ABC transporter permease [Candidatus Limnocylindrales bacterium]
MTASGAVHPAAPSRREPEAPDGELARSFVTAARLGYLMEANWTDPLLFFIYSVAKPVAAALILVVMLQVVGGSATATYRSFVVIGTAFWALVQIGITGLAFAILDDRERYRMLKYVYVSPSDFLVVLLGRGTARLLIGVTGAVITMAIGIVALGVPFDPGRIDWLMLAVTAVGGLVVTLALGLLMGSICLQTRQESWSYPEAFAGALFLVSGAVFPLSILPAPIQAVGLANPLAWWIDGARRAFDAAAPSSIGGQGSLFTTLTGQVTPDNGLVLLSLIVTGAVVTLAAAAIFRYSSRRAKERGLLDRTTGS